MILFELGLFLHCLFMLKYVNYPLPITRPSPFSIIAVDVLDHQSLYNRFQTPIFFSTIAIVSLNIQSFFGP